MTKIRQVKLELLRHGPQHNQLLSPQLPYIALLGKSAPQSVHLPFEHRYLLSRLSRLNYGRADAGQSSGQHLVDLRELGEMVGKVFGSIDALQALLQSVGAKSDELVHLRMSMSALELGMVPFEAAFPADGGSEPYLLNKPLVITRETRRNDPIEVRWNCTPKILFAFASPVGLPAVPAQAHLTALRSALNPYVAIKDDPAQSIESFKKLVTVLPDASLVSIAKACQQNNFTHVHILAHGAPLKDINDPKYGIALMNEHGVGMHVVDGGLLALALRGAESCQDMKDPPLFVSLATCDSGKIGGVVSPGGSIAHALQEGGVPWVVASQFPLWMRASVIVVEALYSGLLQGFDPRCVIYDLRKRLRIEVPETHDWASLVVYAVTPPDLDRQIKAFRGKQLRKRLDVRYERIDELAAGANGKEITIKNNDEFNELATLLRFEHQTLVDRTKKDTRGPSSELSEFLGLQGACEKRIGTAWEIAGEGGLARDAYCASRDAYQGAIQADPQNHWVLTQYLSMNVILSRSGWVDVDLGQLTNLWIAAMQIAEWSFKNKEGEERVWACGTLAELELLGKCFTEKRSSPSAATTNKKKEAEVESRIRKYCDEISQLMGPKDFPLLSTARQFDRYVKVWKDSRWEHLAQAALDALGDPLSRTRKA